MKNYYRIMLGKRSSKASEMYNGKFIGVGFSIEEDLSENDFNDIHDFKAKYVDLYLEKNPKKSKRAATLACGILWRILRDINIGDIVLCPDGKGNYFVGEIVGILLIKIGDRFLGPNGENCLIVLYNLSSIASISIALSILILGIN